MKLNTIENSVYWGPFVFFDIVLYFMMIPQVLTEYLMWPALKRMYANEDNIRQQVKKELNNEVEFNDEYAKTEIEDKK